MNTPSERLRVAIISKALSPGGGASRVAESLARLLRGAGHLADHWVGYYSGPPQPHIRQLHGEGLRPLVRAAHRLGSALGLQTIIPAEYPVIRTSGLPYDLIHVHDAVLTASPLTIWLLAKKLPVAWTLHDCSTFTGGCLYPLGCDRYPHRCGDCPRIGEWPMQGGLDLTEPLRRLKQRLWREGRISFAAPSAWMRDQAMRSGMFPAPPEILSNGIDTALFHPAKDKTALRQRLGLPVDAPVVLLSSGSLKNPFKGAAYGLAALRRCPQRPFVLFVGSDRPDDAALEGLNWKATGYIKEESALAEWYAAGDALLFPSLQDNQPLTVIEALACGLPAISSARNGSAVFVDPRLVLADPGDADALARLIQEAAADINRPAFSWPDDRPCGLAPYLDMVDEILHRKRSRP